LVVLEITAQRDPHGYSPRFPSVLARIIGNQSVK
jgi:hypothetical protein